MEGINIKIRTFLQPVKGTEVHTGNALLLQHLRKCLALAAPVLLVQEQRPRARNQEDMT